MFQLDLMDHCLPNQQFNFRARYADESAIFSYVVRYVIYDCALENLNMTSINTSVAVG